MPTDPHHALHLFQAHGVELEYMIVDSESLAVRPIADRLMTAASGSPAGEIEQDLDVSWSNELALHVVELKTSEPTKDFDHLAHRFGRSVEKINAYLRPMGARLMPGAMHPFMDPATETKIWPHEYAEVYNTFDRLFDCKRHGWANLQSVHLNLPFHADDEFGRLHAAVRLLLPLLPALCASSPIMDGRATGKLCNRLDVYQCNQAAEPALTGRVIPEPAFTRAAYERLVLNPIAETARRLDPSGLLQPLWLNSRGAIARFDRGSIEVRVMDVQECPAADAALCAAVSKVLQFLAAEGPSDSAAQRAMDTERLRAVFDLTVASADQALVADEEYIELLTMEADGPKPAWELWSELFDLAEVDLSEALFEPVQRILDEGPLARRILNVLDNPPGPVDPGELREVYADLCACLAEGRMFDGA